MKKSVMRGSKCVRKAVPYHIHLPVMAVMVQQTEGMRDIITDKHVWHLSDKAIKNVCKKHVIEQWKRICSTPCLLVFVLSMSQYWDKHVGSSRLLQVLSTIKTNGHANWS
ncbi:unnamed protein product [Eruca vesicaria subsp. sativa]|uniref:Uncharacterized protein n=1 Tax=Eruca vesicaria subsp. sativa TaxID=29727 RepID=A0ABC8KI77_ERUVS|nr:unnamed protein product [Eruca vesicaria subsp. sativa]